MELGEHLGELNEFMPTVKRNWNHLEGGEALKIVRNYQKMIEECITMLQTIAVKIDTKEKKSEKNNY